MIIHISIIIIAVILLRLLPDKFFLRKKGKTYGKIIKYVIENNKHYPVFHFETNDGRIIENRNTTYLEELSVEDAYTDEAEEFLNKGLPIEHILIYYDKRNPEDFIPRWINK